MKALAVLPLALALAACAEPRADLPSAPRVLTHRFDAASGASARVFRAIGEDGAEALRGETDLGALCVTESATLDAGGALVRAEIVVAHGCEGPVEERFVVDRASGMVRAAAPGGTVAWPVPRDHAWVIGPTATVGATPVMAWIAARADRSGGEVRVLALDGRRSYRTPREQVAIDTELGTTVVLGGASAEVDRGFVRSVRSADGAVLERRDGVAGGMACAIGAGEGR